LQSFETYESARNWRRASYSALTAYSRAGFALALQLVTGDKLCPHCSPNRGVSAGEKGRNALESGGSAALGAEACAVPEGLRSLLPHSFSGG
jgi:hypothetical protein